MSMLTNKIGKELLHAGLELQVSKKGQFKRFVKPGN